MSEELLKDSELAVSLPAESGKVETAMTKVHCTAYWILGHGFDQV